MYQTPLTELKFTATCLFDLDKENFLDHFEYGNYIKELKENLNLILKQNGLVTRYNTISKIFKNRCSGLELDYTCFNVSFFHSLERPQFPDRKHADKIEELITTYFAKEGLSPKIEISMKLNLIDQKEELITGPPLNNLENIESHFHLIIPNKSGNGTTSYFGEGEEKHYHRLKNGILSGPIKEGVEVVGHTHSFPNFKQGYYDSSFDQDHSHSHFYIDEFGNGEIIFEGNEAMESHTHAVLNGKIKPCEIDGHDHHIII